MYSIFCLRAASHLSFLTAPTVPKWIEAVKAGIQGIEYLGDAVEGDRTMLDALWPALRAMETLSPNVISARSVAKAALDAARVGVEGTKNLIAKRGRSSYLRERVLGHVDPGAKAIEIAVAAITEAISK